jgi:hypothetical protein
MRFMMSVITKSEDQGNPPQSLMDAMGELIERAVKAGTMVDTGGLAPAAMATTVRLQDGKLNVKDGPFSEAKEMIGGYAIMQFNSKEEAIQAAKDFMDLHIKHWPGWNGASEIRQIFGPND